MNASQAKQIKLTQILDDLGFKPLRQERGGRELKYLSPLRGEKTPSFNVSLDKNCWIDFGSGTGGNTLDFAIAYLSAQGKASNVSEALKWLENFTSCANTSDLFPRKAYETKKSPDNLRALKFLKAHNIQNSVILDYLEQVRHIPNDLARSFLQEIHYLNTNLNKTFYGFGIINKSGGYEIRSASNTYVFKSALIIKDISLISSKVPTTDVLIFEGMLDALSYLAIQDLREFQCDCIIMHSLSSFGKTKTMIEEGGYKRLYLFMDNDESGQICRQRFKSELTIDIQSQNHLYKHHKDVNKALVHDALIKPDLFSFSQHHHHLSP